MANIRVLGDVKLSGSLEFSQGLSDFPTSPEPRTMVVKDGMPYIYTELITSASSSSNPGFMSWIPMGVRYANYVHSQGLASQIWTVTHNFGTEDFIYFVYDNDHNLVMANNEVVNANTVRILLSEAMTGTAVLFSADQLSAPVVNMNGGISGTGDVTQQELTNAIVQVEAYTDSAITAALANVSVNSSGSSSTNFAANTLTVSGNIMPAVNGVSTIGSPSNKFAAMYTKEMHIDANTLYVDGVPVLGSSANTITVTADVNQGLRLATTGTGPLVLDSQATTTVKANGVNADVMIQSEGSGSITRISSSTQNTLTAPVTAVVGNATVSGNLAIAGNLSISGSTTIVDTTNLSVKDNIVTVNKGEAGSGVTLRYAGVEVDRGDLARQRLVWDETAGKWKAGETNSEVALATEAYVTSSLGGKANAATTLSGYGITNAYTKTEVDSAVGAKANTSSLATVATSGSYVDLTNKPTLANVATSGSYADLTNKPDTVSLSAPNTYTATQTYNGNASAVSAIMVSTAEPVAYSTSAISSTVNFDVTTQPVMYYSGNATANWTVNFRGSSTATLDSLLAVGQCITATLFVAQGSTAYYCPTVKVDGVTINPKWLGGVAPTAGNALSLDSYGYTIIKTAAATFVVVATQSQFA